MIPKHSDIHFIHNRLWYLTSCCILGWSTVFEVTHLSHCTTFTYFYSWFWVFREKRLTRDLPNWLKKIEAVHRFQGGLLWLFRTITCDLVLDISKLQKFWSILIKGTWGKIISLLKLYSVSIKEPIMVVLWWFF